MICEADDGCDEDVCFERLSVALRQNAGVMLPDALPPALSAALVAQVRDMSDSDFSAAGIGRSDDHMLNRFVRRDQICWIDGATDA